MPATHVDYLIIGQGICGTFLCHELEKENLSFLVIDDGNPGSASRIASGIINPVTGRRIVKSWMIDELMPFAWKTYKEMEAVLAIPCIIKTALIDFFPTPQMRLAFLTRYEADQQYLSLPGDENDCKAFFNYDFGYGSIHPCYLIHLNPLLQQYRQRLLHMQQLREEQFRENELVLTEEQVQYNGITASKIIYCNGNATLKSRYFKNLPFAENKGEALIVEIKDLPRTSIVKKGTSLVPWKENLYWVGSSHEWEFSDDQPSAVFREKTIAWLKSFCKLPFTITDHLASVRPATLERRPFVGIHPQYPQIVILNGMGTKGCSIGPYFARQLALHLAGKTALMPEADVKRFSRVLQRS